MLSVVMPSVVMLSVVMASVVMPSVPAPKLGTLVETIWLLHFKSKPQFFSLHFQNGFKKKFFFRQKNIENWIDPSTTDSCGLYNKYFTAVINTKDSPNCAASQFHPSRTFASKAETYTSEAPVTILHSKRRGLNLEYKCWTGVLVVHSVNYDRKKVLQCWPVVKKIS